MTKIIIKPHHFMDIIKLYGSGINHFVPDEKMGHDFYRIANIILENHDVLLRLTTEADDICRPCYMCQNHKCIDEVHIGHYQSKNDYNHMLDEQLIDILKLNKEKEYTATELCQCMFEHHDCIFQVWHEENQDITQKRHDLFVLGAQKYLK